MNYWDKINGKQICLISISYHLTFNLIFIPNILLAEGGGVAGGDGEVEDPDHQVGGGQEERSDIISLIFY